MKISRSENDYRKKLLSDETKTDDKADKTKKGIKKTISKE